MYIYPDNLKSKAVMWMWELKDIGIIAVCGIISILALTKTGFMLPLAATAGYGFLTIRVDDISIMMFAKYKFDRCTGTDTSAITAEIQKVLCGYSRADKLTAELLNKIISKIHIYDGGRVQIELRNGKLI